MLSFVFNACLGISRPGIPLQHDKSLVKYDKTIINNNNCGLKWNNGKNINYCAKGFFGSRFCKHYRDVYDVYGTDKDDTDITDEKAVHQLVAQIKPDCIIHTAAIPVTDFCNEHPEKAHLINVQGALNIAKAADAVNAKMVLLSTEQIFDGNPESGPYKETDVPVPDTVYGQNKVEAEKKLKEVLDELWVRDSPGFMGCPNAAAI